MKNVIWELDPNKGQCFFMRNLPTESPTDHGHLIPQKLIDDNNTVGIQSPAAIAFADTSDVLAS